MVMIAFLIIFPLFYNAFECLMGLVMILTGIPVYLLMVAWENKPKAFLKFSSELRFIGDYKISVLPHLTLRAGFSLNF